MSGKRKDSTNNPSTSSPRKINKKSNVPTCRCPGTTDPTNFIEDVVCNETDIEENEMKIFPLGNDGGEILLVKQKGELHALGTKCTHYGAPLNTGALGEGRIRCPWHGACFNIKTGDIEDYPGLDSLPRYKVSIQDGQIKVKAKLSELRANRRTKQMVEMKCVCPDEPETVVIVGGGPSGATCAETLRQEGFNGRIVMVCRESVLPYDRIKVSKTLDLDVQKLLLRSESFYKENSIETKLGVEAKCLNTEKNIVMLCNGEELHYDYLYIATGAKPRKSNIPGVDLQNVFTIRDYTDAENINKVLNQCKNVVVLGMGFIGMEAAASCIGKSASVTVVGLDPIPFKPVFGEEIGTRVRKEFEDKGIKFVSNTNIKQFIANECNKKIVGEVELQDGTKLPADIVILGIGVTMYTDWIKGSRVKLLDDGSVKVDQYLKTNVGNVYAGGDIAHAPVYCAGISASIGHFALAHYHGKIAALNICKKKTPLRAVPFFFTMLFGKGYRYAGYGKPTRVKVHGSLEDFKFFAYYFKDGKVIAMSSVGRDPIVADFANLLYEGRTLTEEEVEEDPIKWMRNKPKDLQVPSTQDSKSIPRPPHRRNYHTLSPALSTNNQLTKCFRLLRNIQKFL